MQRTCFGRRGGLGALLACLVVTAALVPAEAAANTYTVNACTAAPGGANNSWGAYSNSASLATYSNCPALYDGNNYNNGIGVRNTMAASGYVASGAEAGWTLRAPAGNNLNSLTANLWISRAANTGYYTYIGDDWTALDACWASSLSCGMTFTRTYALGGASFVHTAVGCSNPAPGCSMVGVFANRPNANFQLYSTSVVVNDNTVPSSTPGGSLWTGNWQGGVRTIATTGRDGADGIQYNDVKVDGQVVAQQSHGCDFTRMTPCGTQIGDSWSYDTHQLADGAHSIAVESADAAWLAGSQAGAINVDNHAPDMSAAPVSVAEGEDWTPNNSFTLSWTTPGGQYAPIVKAHYSVCEAASPTTCSVTDGQVSGTNVQSLSGVQVPAAGDYVVRVWLEDAAGNVNSGMASLPVHLRYDPTVPGQAEPAKRNGWLNALEAQSYSQHVKLRTGAAVGPSGIKGYSITTDGSMPDNTIELVGGDADYTINDLPEGRNIVKARAISGAGVPAADSDVGQTEIDVDKSNPETSVSGAPDPAQWQRRGVTLTLTGTDQADLSGMRGAIPDDPDVKDGAYIEYRSDGGIPMDVRGDNIDGVNAEAVTVPVTGDGRHTLTYKAVDFAGNESSEKTIQFKIDQTPPELVAFELQDPAHPATLSVAVSDRTSGVAGGVIEMRKQGSSSWTDLPTRLTGDHLVTTVDDSTLSPGPYEFQARARDEAGNETVSNRRRDGTVEILNAPFRLSTRMTAGFVKAKAKSKKIKVSARCRRSTKCMAKVRKRRAAERRRARAKLPGTVSTMTVAFGKDASVKGSLLVADGQPIGNQVVDVYRELDAVGQHAARIATVRTSAAGRFTYHAPKGPSRIIRFVFDGSETLHPAAAQVKLLVRASSTLKVNKRKVLNGQTVRFSGKAGLPVIRGLKVMDLQAFYRHKWRTFAAPRADSRGRWKFTYRFEATAGLVTYKFRVRVPREASYPYQLGYSRVVKVTVRGR